MSKVKKLLTLEDLAKFCKEQNFSKFSSKETGYQLSVQVPATFEVDDSTYQDNTLLFVKVKLFHIGPNRNGSSVTKEAAEKSLSTIAYKPILANFCEIDGVKDFTSHDMEINEDGTVNYIEHQIGCFTADTPTIQYDETTEKEFIFAKAAIPREYTDACEIIERKNGTKISAELLINEMSYSAKDNILELTDVIVQGGTCLGKNPETGENVEEGMQGARLDIVDFSAENNSVTANADFNDTLVETLKKLNETLEKFNDKNNADKKGGEETMDKLNELLEAYELTLEELDFSTDGLSDEELEAAFNEAFGDAEEFKKKKKKKCSKENSDDGDSTPEDEDFAGCGTKKKKKRCSINTEDNTIEFELSHDDIRMSLYGLLESNWDENSYSWVCEVYDSYFIYQKETYGDSGYDYKYYKQGYSKNGENVELSGDAVEVFSTFVTESEKIALDMIRSQYDELKKFHDDTIAAQDQAQKDEVLNDEKYSVLDGNEKFEQLKKDAEKFSVEEVKTQAKLIFADYVIETGNYSASGEHIEKKAKKIGFNFGEKPKKKTAYGGLFDNE